MWCVLFRIPWHFHNASSFIHLKLSKHYSVNSPAVGRIILVQRSFLTCSFSSQNKTLYHFKNHNYYYYVAEQLTLLHLFYGEVKFLCELLLLPQGNSFNLMNAWCKTSREKKKNRCSYMSMFMHLKRWHVPSQEWIAQKHGAQLFTRLSPRCIMRLVAVNAAPCLHWDAALRLWLTLIEAVCYCLLCPPRRRASFPFPAV